MCLCEGLEEEDRTDISKDMTKNKNDIQSRKSPGRSRSWQNLGQSGKNFFSNMTSLGKFELALASSGKTMSQSGTKVSRRTIN